MTFWDHIKNSLASLMSNKVRTFLTTLGILIGVASVVTLLTVGRSAQGSIEDQFDAFGANNIFIMPGEDQDLGAAPPQLYETFSTREFDRFLNTPTTYVKYKAATSQGNFVIDHKGYAKRLPVVAYGGDFSEAFQITVDRGIIFNETDNAQRKKVALIGPDLVEDLFQGQNPLGEEIKVGNNKFKVIGITKEMAGSSLDNPNQYVSVPLKTYNAYLSSSDGAPVIIAQAKSEQFIEEAKDEIKTIFRKIRNIRDGEKNDFKVRDSGEILDQISLVTGVFTIFLAAVASISLLVGGIGVMNIMFVSITERTKEIGLRKSLGAKNSDILYQFLAESMVVSVLGGIMGIIVGIILSTIINNLADLGTGINTESIVLATIFSLVIGIIFGIYPAQKAAKLNPIDALRYE